MRRRAVVACFGATAIASAAFGQGYISLLKVPVWSVSPKLARQPASAPYDYVIHQKTLQAYDFKASVSNRGLRPLARYVSLEVVPTYTATCGNGTPAVFGPNPLVTKKSDANGLSATVTVKVEDLTFLGDCSAPPKSGSVKLVATAKNGVGKTMTSSVTVDLQP